jgi:hypothetical protein
MYVRSRVNTFVCLPPYSALVLSTVYVAYTVGIVRTFPKDRITLLGKCAILFYIISNLRR